MSTPVPSSLVNTPKTNTSCGTSLAGTAQSQSNGSDLVESPAQEVCGSTVYVGDVDAGVEALRVDESQVDGVVVLQGAGGTTISLSGQTVTVSTDGGVTDGVTRLPQLLDVVLATDDNGNTLVPDGSFLRFNNDPNHPYDGFWTATTVHDGGEY